MLLFPLAVKRMMEALQGQGVGKDLEWRAVLGEKMFAKASENGSATLGRLVDIFVERHSQLWKVRGRCLSIELIYIYNYDQLPPTCYI